MKSILMLLFLLPCLFTGEGAKASSLENNSPIESNIVFLSSDNKNGNNFIDKMIKSIVELWDILKEEFTNK